MKMLPILFAVILLYSCNAKKTAIAENTFESTVDYIFTCNLQNNADIIAKYKHYHSDKGVWSEVTQASKESGAKRIQIYLQATRLVLIITLPKELSFDEFNTRYNNHSPEMKEWDSIMSAFQVPPPGAAEGQTWVPMEKIYDFTNYHQ